MTQLKVFITLLFTFYIELIFGQNYLKGEITDSENGKPISFSNIWILDTNYGTTSSETGKFTLKLDTIITNQKLKISAIGYYDTSIILKSLNLKIKLKPKIYEITEIKVWPKKKEELIINDLRNISLKGGIVNDTTPRITGMFFPYKSIYSKYPYLKSIIIYTRDLSPSKFNIRIYSFDTIMNKPTNELISDNIIAKSRTSLIGKPKYVEVNLLKYSLEIPKSGIFIGVEWLILPENKFRIEYSQSNRKNRYFKTYFGPNLGATIDSVNLSWDYRKGKWYEPRIGRYMKDNSIVKRYLNPAISLKLTN